MSTEKKKELVPKRRFPEFQNSENWELKLLGSLCKIRTGKKDANEGSSDGPYPFFTCAEKHIFSDSYSFDAEAILIAGNANVGQTKYYRGKFEAYQRTYVLTDFSRISAPYLYSVLKAKLKDSLLAQVQVSAMSYIKLPMLQEYVLAVPSNPVEQQKIADCLSSLDELIAAQNRKVEALKTHKKGLMQQLLPREGETQPHLRFPEFQDAADWEVRSLNQVAENLDNRRVPITSSDRAAGDVPYYGASGIVDYVDGFIFDEDLLCVSEDGANLVARTYPIAFPISGKTWVNNHAHVLRFENSSTQKFVEVYLNSIKLDDFITGMAQPKLNKAMLDSIPIPHPDIVEQKKIADCLTFLDAHIIAATLELDTLKMHKKGLMQQLFPSAEALAL